MDPKKSVLTQELDLFLQRAKDNAESSDDIDVYFASKIHDAFPSIVKTLRDNDLLSNGTVAHYAAQLLIRCINRLPLLPLNSFEEAPEEWYDPINLTDGPVDLSKYDPSSLEEGVTLLNRRCPQVYYNPGRKRYYDLENTAHAQIRHMNLSYTTNGFPDDIATTFRPFIKAMGWDVLNSNTEVQMPYYPPTEPENIFVIGWDDDVAMDGPYALYEPYNPKKGFVIEGISKCEFTWMRAHLVLMPRFECMVYVLQLMNEDKCVAQIVNLPAITIYPDEMTDKLRDSLKKEHDQWLDRYMRSCPYFTGFYLFPTGALNLEEEDRSSPLFTFMVPMMVGNLMGKDYDPSQHCISGIATYVGKETPFYMVECWIYNDLSDATAQDPDLQDVLRQVFDMKVKYENECNARAAAMRMGACHVEHPDDCTCEDVNYEKEAD